MDGPAGFWFGNLSSIIFNIYLFITMFVYVVVLCCIIYSFLLCKARVLAAGPSGEGDHKPGLDISSDSDSMYSAPQPIPPANLAGDNDSAPAKPTLDELHAEDVAESDKVESPTAVAADGDEEDVFDDARSHADTDAISNQVRIMVHYPGSWVDLNLCRGRRWPGQHIQRNTQILP